jgi:hypothetical protein
MKTIYNNKDVYSVLKKTLIMPETAEAFNQIEGIEGSITAEKVKEFLQMYHDVVPGAKVFERLQGVIQNNLI